MKLKQLLLTAGALLLSSTAMAQQISKLQVYLGFQNPESMVGKKISTVIDWHCGPSTVYVGEYVRNVFDIPLSRTNDLRNIKALTFRIAEPGEVPDATVESLTVGGIPFTRFRNGDTGALQSENQMGFKYFGVSSVDKDKETSFRPVHIDGARYRMGKTTPFTMRWNRTHLDANTPMASSIRVQLGTRDGCRTDSRLEMMIETYDGQFIHVPVGTIGDNSRKDVSKVLTLPIPERGISKVHFWFNNKLFDSNRPLRNDDSLAQPDDVDLTFSITGRDERNDFELVHSTRVELRDWNNKVVQIPNARERVYADDFVNQLTLFTQTGATPFDWEGSDGHSMRITAMVTDTSGQRHEMIVNDGSANSNGVLLSGGFSAKSLASLATNVSLPTLFRLSQIASVTLAIKPFQPGAGRESFSKTLDLKGLAIGVSKLGDDREIFKQNLLFADMEANHTLTYNFNVARGGSSTRAYPFRASQIIYLLAAPR